MDNAIFKNKYHEAGSNKPTHKGTIVVGGVRYNITMWERESKYEDSPNWYSVAVEKREESDPNA